MISIILSFRISRRVPFDERRQALISRTFCYWQIVRELFHLELIFIDDHSEDFGIAEDFIFPMKGEKVDWNQGAARNYGASLAKGDNLLFTDIDHMLYGDFSFLDYAMVGGQYVPQEVKM